MAGDARRRVAAAGMPGWVKVFIGLGIVLAVGAVLMMAGGHGPGQHMPAAAHMPAAPQ